MSSRPAAATRPPSRPSSPNRACSFASTPLLAENTLPSPVPASSSYACFSAARCALSAARSLCFRFFSPMLGLVEEKLLSIAA